MVQKVLKGFKHMSVARYRVLLRTHFLTPWNVLKGSKHILHHLQAPSDTNAGCVGFLGRVAAG